VRERKGKVLSPKPQNESFAKGRILIALVILLMRFVVSLGKRTTIAFFVMGFSLIIIGFELYSFTENLGGPSLGTAWVNGTKVTGIWSAGFAFPIHPYLDMGFKGVVSGTVILIATFLESIVGKRKKLR
jgi:hypothetical protein